MNQHPACERLRLYKKMVKIIAFNDDPGSPEALDARRIYGNVTIVICAWTFKKSPRTVARDVVAVRKAQL